MATCGRCGGRLPRRGDRCPHCGALDGELALEPVEPHDATTSAADVDLGRPRPRRRTVLVGGAVAAALVAAALAVDHGGDREARPDPTPTTSSAAPTTTSVAPVTVPGPPTSTTTTTTLPDSYTASVAPLAEPTGGTVLDAVDRVGGVVVRVDLDTGAVRVRRFAASGCGDDCSPLAVVSRRGGTLVVPMWDSQPARFVPSDPSQPVVWLSQDDGLLVAAADGGLLWRLFPPYAGQAVDRTATVVDLAGRPVLPALSLPTAGVAGDDGNGRLLLLTRDGTFVADAHSRAVSRVDHAPAVAWTAGFLLTTACDDHLGCRFRVVDRAGGQALLGGPVPADLPLLAEVPLGLLDPTGRRLARFDRGTMQVVDLADGSVTAFPAPWVDLDGLRFPFAWSADGRWLFWPDDTTVAAWHPGLAEPLRLALPVRGVEGVAVVAHE